MQNTLFFDSMIYSLKNPKHERPSIELKILLLLLLRPNIIYYLEQNKQFK